MFGNILELLIGRCFNRFNLAKVIVHHCSKFNVVVSWMEYDAKYFKACRRLLRAVPPLIHIVNTCVCT